MKNVAIVCFLVLILSVTVIAESNAPIKLENPTTTLTKTPSTCLVIRDCNSRLTETGFNADAVINEPDTYVPAQIFIF